MITLLVTNSHEILVTQNERIMQRSNLANKLHFLVPPTYDDIDLSNATVCLEYLTPIGREYKTEILTVSEELYKGHLEYKLPVNTDITKEYGKLELQLTFTSVTMDINGKIEPYVRKTSPAYLNIIPIASWSDYIPDSSLTAIDQRILKTNAMIQQMYDINMALADSVPDDLMIKNGRVYLSKDGSVMENTAGADVVVPRTYDDDELSGDGVIELGEIIHNEDDPDCDCGCDHNNFEELDSYVATPPEDPEFGNFTEL